MENNEMVYKGYEITASAKTYVTWALNDEGDPVEAIGRDDGEVEGYFAKHVETGEELDFIESKWADAAKTVIDDLLDEKAA